MVEVTDERCFTDCSWLRGKIRCRNCPYTEVRGGDVIILDNRVKARRSGVKQI